MTSDYDVELVRCTNVEGATDEQVEMYGEMATLFGDAFQTFVEKNLDYGSSFLTAGQVEQVLDQGGGPFESERQANLYKLFTRLQDKNQRFYNLVFGGGDDHVGEAAMDTAVDAAVYWFMVAWLLQQDDG